jgi:uncharacterized protein (DUF58 family)
VRGGGESRLLDPTVLARISNLELVSRVVVEGFLGGLHRSPRFGASTDFAEHRPYVPGDDVRRVDWKLWARTDRYHMKEFEADTDTNVTVLLDASRSMDFKGPGSAMTKLEYAKRLAACLLYFSQRQRDRVGLAVITREVREVVRPAAGQLSAALHALDRLTPGTDGALAPPLRVLAERFRRRSIIVLISDLYEEPSAVVDALAHIRGRGNDLIVFHVLDRAEIDFPYEEAGTFEDLESGVQLPLIPSAVRDKYNGLMAAHTDSLQRQIKDSRADYSLFDTSKPLDHALYSYLAARERLGRVR